MASTDRIDGLTGSNPMKSPVAAATTANITLSGEQTIDSTAVVTGDRVLVKNQTTASENGIYEVSTGTWTRTKDFNGNGDVVKGTIVLVLAGATQYLKIYRLDFSGTVTIGTTSLSFFEVNGSFDGTTTSTISALKGIVTADTQLAFVTGYYAVGDRPPRIFYFDAVSAETDNGGTVIAPNVGSGRWKMVHDGRLHVNDFGAGSGQTGAVNTAAISATFAADPDEIFMDNATYNIWPTGTVAGTEVLINASSKKGLRIDGRGAVLNVEDIMTGSEQPTVLKLDGCENVTVENLEVTNGTPMTTSNGVVFAHLTNATKRVHFQNIKVANGITGIECVRDPTTQGASTKCDGISFLNCEFNNVAYPINFQNSGDNVFARNIVIDGCARAYFPYGVDGNHDIELSVKNATTSPTCNITVHSTDATTNQTSNIRLKVVSLDNTPGSQPNLVGLNWSFVTGSGLACTMRNIDVEILADYDNTSAQYAMFSCQKTIAGSGADSTASRGHVGENIDVKVSLRGCTNAGNRIVMFSSTQGNWTGESIRGVRVQAQFDTNGDVLIDGTPFQDRLVMTNCRIPDTSSDSLVNFSKGVWLENTEINSVNYNNAYWPETATGTVTITSQGITYIDSSGGAVTATLGNGEFIGQEKVIVMTDASNSSTLSVTNHETSAPEVFTFAAIYDLVKLVWTGNTWDTILLSGATV